MTSSQIMDSLDSLPVPSVDETPEAPNHKDWRAKACDLLEEYISEIKKNNEELANESAALARCLHESLSNLIQLSHNSDRNVPDQEKLIEYLSELSELHSDLDYEPSCANWPLSPAIPTLDDIPPSYSTGTNKFNHSSHLVDDQDYEPPLISTTLSKPSPPVPVKVRKSYESQSTHLRQKPEPAPPTTAATSAVTVSQSKQLVQQEEDDSETQLIRTAFRLFAKHIGPSLKREHRIIFNSPPTQAWLADQLLTRWDGLDPRERQNWLRRVQTAS